ncbi:MAG: hypothetical protein ACE37N_16020, partial [Pseudohongiellaceae bacterium]
MDKLELTKQFISKYYPRDHVYLAGTLCLFLVFSLLWPASDAESDLALSDARSTSIAVPVGTQSANTEVSSAETPSPEKTTVVSTPQPETPADTDQQSTTDLSDYVVTPEPQLGLSLEELRSRRYSLAFYQGRPQRSPWFQVERSEEAKILNRLYPGYRLDFMVPSQGELEQLRVMRSPLEGYLFTRSDSGYRAEHILKEAELQQAFKVGTIADSLFMAGQRESIPAVHIMEMANIFGGVIDFILDPRAGDQFSILYEEKYLDGEFIGPGEILATRFVNQGKVFTAVRYVDENGEVGYYSPEGESMRKAFLRNPLDVFRISSNFNP